jgi:tripartite-type tricarboxylate transporter receptor subunit TctC
MNPWFGVLGPAGVPPEIVAKLNAELVRILKSGDIAAQFAAQGVQIAHSSPAQFLVVIQSDLEKWRKVIAEAGIKAE